MVWRPLDEMVAFINFVTNKLHHDDFSKDMFKKETWHLILKRVERSSEQVKAAESPTPL